MLNPLQIYTDYATMQVTAREKRCFVDNLKHLLINEGCFVGFFTMSVMIRVYSILAFSSKVKPLRKDFTSILRLPGSFKSFIIM